MTYHAVVAKHTLMAAILANSFVQGGKYPFLTLLFRKSSRSMIYCSIVLMLLGENKYKFLYRILLKMTGNGLCHLR